MIHEGAYALGALVEAPASPAAELSVRTTTCRDDADDGTMYRSHVLRTAAWFLVLFLQFLRVP